MYIALYKFMMDLWFRKMVASGIKRIPISQYGGGSESEITEGSSNKPVLCFYAVLRISGEGFEHAASWLIRIMMMCGLIILSQFAVEE
jgi:hypothetical protein